MSYNSLDNRQKAIELRTLLQLERDDINDSLNYEYATSWCDDCPRREHEPQSYEELEFGIRVAPNCCKDDEIWADEHQDDFALTDSITDLIKHLTHYIGDEKSEQASPAAASKPHARE